MANLGILNASYYTDTSISRLKRQVDVSVEKVSSNKANIANGDKTSLVSMDNSFKLDLAATNAAVKNMSVAQAYLSTAISTLDNASAILTKIHELAVLGANGSNSDADNAALNTESEALIDAFHKSMTVAQFKGKEVFTDEPSTFSLASGGRSNSIQFGVGKVDYDVLYDYSNPGQTVLTGGVNYEIKRDLSDTEKQAILSRSSNLTAEQLVKGFQFKTDPVEDINRGGGSMSVITESAPTNNIKTYNRGDNRIKFDADATVQQVGNFKGGYLDIELTGNNETSDNLSLQNTTRLKNGNAVDSVRILNGVVAYSDPIHGFIDIGKIVDETNGVNGKKLRIQLFDDASIPGTGIIENANFEKQVLSEGSRPTKTFTRGEHRTGVVGNFTITDGGSGVGGTGYTQKNDKLTTGLARGSDTFSLNFTGGSGNGFRAHVNVVGGSVQIVEVLDKGSGYTANDVLTLNNAVELGGAGTGFQVTVNSIVNSLGDGNGTQGVELVKTPNFVDIPAVNRHTQNDRYAWGEQYFIDQVVREAVPDNERQNSDTLTNFRHTAGGSYANDPGWTIDIDNTTLNPNYIINEKVKEQIAIGDQVGTDTPIYATDQNGQVIVDQIAVGQQNGTDRKIVVGTLQIPVGQQNGTDQPVKDGVIRIEVGQQNGTDTPVKDGVIRIEVGQQNGTDRAVNATNGNQPGVYSWGESFAANSPKKTLTNGDTPSPKFHTAPGTYNFDATGTGFNLVYEAGAPDLERIEVGQQTEQTLLLMDKARELVLRFTQDRKLYLLRLK